MTTSPLGLHRVIEPPGVLPQAAWRLDASPALAEGTFGVTKRAADGGRGLDGVIKQAGGYYNPATETLEVSS